MDLTVNDDYRWNRVLDAEFSNGSSSPLWDASRTCQLGKILLDPIVERIKACFGKFENAIGSLEQTLNQVWSVLNRNSNEGITKNQEDISLDKPFIVDDKIYYHPIPGERMAVRSKHPFEAFEVDELPLLDEDKLMKFKDMKVLARGNRALAFFFYKNLKLSATTKQIIGRIFRAYLKEMKSVSNNNISIYVKKLDSGWNRSFNYLKKVVMWLRRIVTFSYKFRDSFPEIILNARKKPKIDVSPVTSNQIWRAHRMLLRNKNYKYALLLRLMFTFALMPYELRMLRFDDVCEVGDGK